MRDLEYLMLFFYILIEVLLHSIFIHKNSLDCMIEMWKLHCLSMSLINLIKLVATFITSYDSMSWLGGASPPCDTIWGLQLTADRNRPEHPFATAHEFIYYYGLDFIPKIHILKSSPPIPQNVTVVRGYLFKTLFKY